MYDKIKRWNFEPAGLGVEVCKDEHEKGQPCEYKMLKATEVINIIDELKSEIFKCYSEIEDKDKVIQEVNSWAVCSPISTPKDMMENIQRIMEITTK